MTRLQLTSQALRFEVVSVKTNVSGAGPLSLRSRPDGGFTATNITLGILLGQAFPQLTQDMVGVPDWASAARFDVNATAPPGIGNATPEQRRVMLQAMLADRFKLVTHYDTREVPAYHLMLARSDGRLGPQLTLTDIDCAARSAAQRAAADAARAAGQPPPTPLPPPTASPTDPTLSFAIKSDDPGPSPNNPARYETVDRPIYIYGQTRLPRSDTAPPCASVALKDHSSPTSKLLEPHDYVRNELESALARGIRVVPVLLASAAMPDPRELPPVFSH